MSVYYLNNPVTNISTEICSNEDYLIATSSMQGWRHAQEDITKVYLEAPFDPQSLYCGLFDGHSGTSIAQYLAENLHDTIMINRIYPNDIPQAIEYAFLDIDEYMKEEPAIRRYSLGSTALIIIIRDRRLYCANLGDSRAIGFVDGIPMELSTDHKPQLPAEEQRINAAGGYVRNDRVCGDLSVSRAFGDYKYKRNEHKSPSEQIISCCPEIRHWKLDKSWRFVILGCDGIWDTMTTDEVGSFVYQRLEMKVHPVDIVEELITKCLANDGTRGGPGTDNLTVMLIVILKFLPLNSRYTILSAKPTRKFNPTATEVPKSSEKKVKTKEQKPSTSKDIY